MASDVEIRFRAQTDQAISGIKGVEKSAQSLLERIKGATRGFQDIQAALNMGMRAFNSVKRVVDELTSSFVDYGMQVADLSRATGASAEETSKLIQAADDAFVSYESLTVAMKRAIQQGIDPSLEGMMKLSDEYLAIEDPIKRSQFLIETFGRSGLEMGKLLEKGSDAIREMGDEAERVGLVLGQDDVEAARLFKEQLDQLNDQVEAVKINMGRGLVKAASDVLYSFDQLTGGMSQDLLPIVKEHQQDMLALGVSYEEYRAEMERTISVVEGSGIAAFTDQQKAALLLNEELFNSAQAVGKLDRFYGDLINSSDDYVRSLWASNTAIGAVDEGFGGLITEADILTASMKDLTVEMLYQNAAAGLDARASLELARSLGLVDEGTYAALNAQAELRRELEAGELTIDQYIEKTGDLAYALNLLDGTSANVYVNYITSGDPTPGAGDEGLDGDAPVIIPPDEGGVYNPGGGGVGTQSMGGTTMNIGAINVQSNNPGAVVNRLRILEVFGV
jgi:hypothetical protein